jgi:hypothetical protein
MGMLGQNFPISEYYRTNIIDAETVARSGRWWTALLVIKDPKTEKPFVGLYRWENDGSAWKVRKNFPIRSRKSLQDIIRALQRAETIFPDE